MDIVPESCRLCLSSGEPTFAIYERLSLAEITEVLQDMLGIQINNSDEYMNICHGCEMKAKLVFNITTEFRQADKLFCSFLDQKRASQGISSIEEENKDAIELVSIMPLDVIEEEEKIQTEFLITEVIPTTVETKNVQKLVVTKKDGSEPPSEDEDEIDADPDFIEESFQDDDYTSDEEKPSTSGISTLFCYICKGFSGGERSLQAHLKDQHNALVPYYCEKCLIGIDDMVALNLHLQSHEFPYGCLFCEELFATESEMETHRESCVGYQCSHCHNYFQFVQGLKEHECKASRQERMRRITAMVGSRRNQAVRFVPQICGMCNEDMGKNHRLAQHFEREHENFQLLLYKCDVCPQKFTTLMAVRLHRLMIHKKNSAIRVRKVPAVERNECRVCGRTFKFNKLLLAHMEAEHADSGLNFHQCPKCDKKFTSGAKLYKHDYNTHQGKQPQFFCSFCGRVFNKKLGLRDHENLHRGVKQYHCEDCNKDFTYKSTYDRHMQVVHSDAKEFTCEYCNKSFKRKPTLKVHLRLHTGEKPYQCEYCSRRFVDPSSFHKHKQKEHGWKSNFPVA